MYAVANLVFLPGASEFMSSGHKNTPKAPTFQRFSLFLETRIHTRTHAHTYIYIKKLSYSYLVAIFPKGSSKHVRVAWMSPGTLKGPRGSIPHNSLRLYLAPKGYTKYIKYYRTLQSHCTLGYLQKGPAKNPIAFPYLCAFFVASNIPLQVRIDVKKLTLPIIGILGGPGGKFLDST
jgi:hypothetical protein